MLNKNTKIYILSFALPILFLLIAMAPLQIFPFGNGSFIYWDAELQYVNFLGYFKSLFTSNNDLFYTFSRMGGASMLDFSAYYLLSPLNLLLFFFPNEYLNIGLEFLMILRLGLCGLTFSYFLNKEFSYDYKNIFFALTYALCGYNIMYMSNTIYFDGIILLPLVILGISKIISKDKSLLYIFSLVPSIITNAYIGYVTLIFSGTFFIYKMLLSDVKEKIEVFKRIKTYLISTAISIGLTTWLLIPVKMALDGGKYNLFSNESSSNLITINKFLAVISKFYTHAFIDKMFWAETTPFIFVGILLFLLLILYFFNRNISKKERVITFLYTTLVFSGFFFNVIFKILNMGVAVPTGTIFRFAFFVEFFIIYVAYKSFLNIAFIKNKQLLATGAGFVVLSLYIFFKNYPFIDNNFLFHDVIIASVILFLIFCHNNKFMFYKSAIMLIFAIHLCNIFINTNYALTFQILNHLSQEVQTFSENYRGVKDALNYIYQKDKSFFRTEVTSTFTEVPKISSRLETIYMLHGYNAVSHYSTLGKTNVANFYENIGFNGYIKDLIVNYYEKGMIFPAFFMGIKYVVSNNPNLPYPYEKLYEIKDYIHHSLLSLYYKDLYNYNDLYVYKNPYSLPIAFTINDNENLYKIDELDNNKSKYQNSLIKALANEDLGDIYIYKKLPITLNTKENILISRDKIISNNRLYLLAKRDDSLLMYFDYSTKSKINFGNDNEFETEFYYLDQQTLYLGENLLGKTLNADFNLNKITKPETIDVDMYLVYENLENLKKYYDKLSQNSCDLTKITSSHLRGECEIKKDNQLLFFTIPYDKNWHIYIDNEKVVPEKLFNAMMGIPVKRGAHVIEMRYIPAGIWEGTICSLLSLVALIVFMFYKKNNVD